MTEAFRLSATEAAARMRDGRMSASEYASALLARIEETDGRIEAWAHLDPRYVGAQAASADAVPAASRAIT